SRDWSSDVCSSDLSFGNEHQFGNKETHSIQRDAEGNYVAGLPTPGMLNDGSGVQFNGLSILVDTSDKVEGTDFDITFTLQQAPTTDLAFKIGRASCRERV